MYAKRKAAAVLVAVTLAATPAQAYTRHVEIDVGSHAAHDAGRDLAIGMGITTGVLAVVGGAIWYYIHHRHASAAPAIPPPDDGSAPN